MRIAYVCHWNMFLGDGVAKKIHAQTAAWRRLGHDVELFWLAKDPGRPVDDDGTRFLFEPPLGRPLATRRLDRAVAAFRPDVAYLRYHIFLPPLPRLFRAAPVVVEVNTDDDREFRLWSKRLWLYNRLNRRLIFGRASGLVFVTEELARNPRFTSFRKSFTVIANGAEPPSRTAAPGPRSERARLVFLGTHGPWQGFDKVLALARALPEYDFDLVGIEPAHVDGSVPRNAMLHGLLDEPSYAPILARADVGLGTLALHRKEMSEASPLKTREYLLSGLPVVLGYRDTDLPQPPPSYVLELPNEERNVEDNVPEIRTFVERVRGTRVPRDDVVERMTVDAKERARLAFLQRVAGDVTEV
jgi:hypothetical protein